MRDEAARIIWERFAPRLRLLVRRHLDNRILRREDEHDILQNTFASFCQGQSAGKTAPASRKELWKLLVRITMCKVINTAHRHMADRRDFRRERCVRQQGGEGTQVPHWMLDYVDRSQPRPEERMAVVEEVQRLLDMLNDEELRQIVLWKLEGFTNADISDLIGKTVRSVELKLQLIRKLLDGQIDQGAIRRKPTPGGGRAPADPALSSAG
jgi:RNA polymerase sigma-70 factor (ECF subfamily)